MKTSMIKAIRIHLLMMAIVITGACLIAPNEQGIWCALFVMACWGILWFVIPTPQPVLHHDDEPYVAYAEIDQETRLNAKEYYALMAETIEKDEFLRQCGTLN